MQGQTQEHTVITEEFVVSGWAARLKRPTTVRPKVHGARAHWRTIEECICMNHIDEFGIVFV